MWAPTGCRQRDAPGSRHAEAKRRSDRRSHGTPTWRRDGPASERLRSAKPPEPSLPTSSRRAGCAHGTAAAPFHRASGDVSVQPCPARAPSSGCLSSRPPGTVHGPGGRRARDRRVVTDQAREDRRRRRASERARRGSVTAGCVVSAPASEREMLPAAAATSPRRSARVTSSAPCSRAATSAPERSGQASRISSAAVASEMGGGGGLAGE